MNKWSKLLGIALLTVFIGYGCQEEKQSEPNGAFQPTNQDSVYLNQDEDALADNMTVSNSGLSINDAALNSSLHLSQEQNDSNPMGKWGSAVGDVALSLVGETAASKIDNLVLQATDVALKSNRAYVSYNHVGDTYAGAIQVVDVKNEESPKMIAELLFTDIDINAIYLNGNVIYAVGAAKTSSRNISSPAVLIIISVKKGIPQNDITIIDLPSYAGTDVIVKGQYIYATVGADGGGLVRIRKNSPSSFNSANDYYAIDDARSLAVEGSTLGVLKGTDGSIFYFNTGNTGSSSNVLSAVTVERQVNFAGTATIENSKSTIDLLSDITIVALGDGGTKLIATDDVANTQIISIDAINGTSTLTADKTVTNAVTLDKDLLFRANGEAGVDFYRLSKKARNINQGDTVTTTRIGSISFESLTSANGLYYRKGWLFVADGLGGMKIIKVDRYFSLSTDEDEDDDQEDQDDEDDDD